MNRLFSFLMLCFRVRWIFSGVLLQIADVLKSNGHLSTGANAAKFALLEDSSSWQCTFDPPVAAVTTQGRKYLYRSSKST